MSTAVDLLQMTIPHEKYPEIDDHFGRAGKEAVQGVVAEYRRPQPAAENDELTKTLKRMRALAAHNFGGK